MRILYVEDNPANVALVQRVARMGGHDMVTYTSGESALANFERDKPDLVLLDVQLEGELTGLDVVRRLRTNGHTLPIIAVTAYAMVGDKEKCLEAGCSGYLAKPLPVAELVEIIQKHSTQLGLLTAADSALAGARKSTRQNLQSANLDALPDEDIDKTQPLRPISFSNEKPATNDMAKAVIHPDPVTTPETAPAVTSEPSVNEVVGTPVTEVTEHEQAASDKPVVENTESSTAETGQTSTQTSPQEDLIKNEQNSS